MRFTLRELESDPVIFDRKFAPGEISLGDEATQTGPLHAHGRADLIQEHRGPRDIVSDIRVRGQYEGDVDLPCARCLDPVPEHTAGSFDLIYRPLGVEEGGDEHSISESETEIGYYQGDGLELEDVLREQILLSLPARALCSDACKGLCPHCGENQNKAGCTCEAKSADPRWSALAGLRARTES